MNPSIPEILAHTPPWVFILLAYLVWIGVLRLRPGIRQLGRIWITPAIFIAWGVVGLVRHPTMSISILPHWVIGALIGAALGSLGQISLTVDRPRQLVLLPGSVLPLIRVLVIFGAHYVLRVAAALHPDSRDTLLTADVYVSGASAGYFIAWSVRFLRSYRIAPHADLAPVVPLKG